MTVKNARLSLKQMEFQVRLGWGEAERQQPQTIFVDFHIDFNEPPAACETDQLNDTLCYDTLNQRIRQTLLQSEFKLIEFLAKTIYSVTQSMLTKQSRIWIGIHKHPDAFFKSGGVTFWYGDQGLQTS